MLSIESMSWRDLRAAVDLNLHRHVWQNDTEFIHQRHISSDIFKLTMHGKVNGPSVNECAVAVVIIAVSWPLKRLIAQAFPFINLHSLVEFQLFKFIFSFFNIRSHFFLFHQNSIFNGIRIDFAVVSYHIINAKGGLSNGQLIA